MERPRSIPTEPGCYLFRNSHGTVIYVGKARSLAQRLANYFQRTENLTAKTALLMSEATSVEWAVTGSEVDALILENELIKTHQPRYNMRLKDDKSFPFLALDFRSDYPYPYVTRGAHHKGVTYYGPFAHVAALKRIVDELLRTYPLRSCNSHKFAQHERMGRPCLLADVGKCTAPCTRAIGVEEYRELVAGFAGFFEGRVGELRRTLEARMADDAAHQRYEAAARDRDSLAALDRAAQAQRVVLDDDTDLDAIHVTTSGSRAAVLHYRVRGGRIVGRNVVLIDLSFDEPPAEVIERALGELYPRGDEIPRQVVVDDDVADSTVLADYLSRLRQGPVTLSAPQRGRRRRLVELVAEDGAEVLRNDSNRRAHDHNARSRALTELGEALGLAQPPYRIECFDMSHLQGTNYVGSMVCFEDGLPRRGAYRHFNVRTVLGNDDVGAMAEVVARRFRHWSPEGGDDAFGHPDLVIIDGGLPQLHAAERALANAGVPPGAIELCALAKREELLYRPGTSVPVVLERGSESLYLVQRVRDEAHRFAITFHRSKRGRAMVATVLDEVPGLGPQRQAQLLSQFGSIDAIRTATLAELCATKGLPESAARATYDHFHPTGELALKREGLDE